MYPNYKNKHLEEALFHPRDFINYKKWNKKKLPKKYVIVYDNKGLKQFLRKVRGKYKKLRLDYYNCEIFVYKGVGILKMSGIGSPHAATIFEEIIALGGKEFLNIGTAGGLQNEGVFLCNKAIRDEGTSHHYIPPGKYSYPDKKLTEKLEKCLIKNKIKFNNASTWTIDAPYRETRKEIRFYKKQGIATVEMEASALFAVAKIRKVRIATAFVVSDVLGEKWEPKFHHINVIETLNKLIDVSIDCLSGK